MLKLELVTVLNFMQACVTSQSTLVVLQAETSTSQMKNLIAYHILPFIVQQYFDRVQNIPLSLFKGKPHFSLFIETTFTLM